MKFKMKFTNAVYFLTGTVIAVTLAASIVDILILTETGRFLGGNVVVTSVSLACSIILCAVCIILLTCSSYAFKKDALKVYFGFYPISFYYTDILAVVEEEITRKLYVQYADAHAKDGYGILSVNIKQIENSAFIRTLKENNPDIKTSDDSDDNATISG